MAIAIYLVFYYILLVNLVAIFNYCIVLRRRMFIKLRNKQIDKYSFVIDIRR